MIGGDGIHPRVSCPQQVLGEFVGHLHRGDGDLDVDHVARVHPGNRGRADVVDPQRAVSAGGVQPGQDARSRGGPAGIGRHHGVRAGCRCAGGDVVGERQDPLVPQLPGALDKLALGARVVQPDVGHRTALLVGGLGGDPGPGVGLVHAANVEQPGQAHVRIGVDHHHQREQRRHPGFDQQWNVLDDHLVLGHRSDDLGTPTRDQRMHDFVELRALSVIAECPGG